VLGVSIASGGKFYSPWILWTGGAVLALAFLCMVVLSIHLEDDDKATYFLRTYKLWSPAWMRWSLNISTTAFVISGVLISLGLNLPHPHPWMKELTPHLPYIFGCWGFLLCASFLTAVQRSQEQVGLPVK
jgi:hypothetical protein